MKNFLLFILSTAALTGCTKSEQSNTDNSKEKTVVKEPDEKCLVLTINNSVNAEKINLEYDSDSRVTKAVHTAEQDGEKYDVSYSFLYESDKITVVEHSGSEFLTKYVYLLKGEVISSKASFVEEENGTAISKEDFAYDKGGYLNSIILSEDIGFPEGNTTKISYKDGNILTLDSSTEGIFTAIYNTDNRLPFTEQNTFSFSKWFFETKSDAILYEQGFFGKLIKNQLQSVTRGTTKSELKYIKNATGRTNQLSVSDGTASLTYSYEFKCEKVK